MIEKLIPKSKATQVNFMRKVKFIFKYSSIVSKA